MTLTGSKHPLWKGGRYKLRGYWMVLCEGGKYRLEHRVVAEKKLGRPLEKGEVVHHINHNKTDNRIENLIVLSTSEHIRHHWEKEENPFCQPRKKIKECKVCHEVQTIYAKGQCSRCYHRLYMRQWKLG